MTRTVEDCIAITIARSEHALLADRLRDFSGQADKAQQPQVWVLLDMLASDSSTDGGFFSIPECSTHTSGSQTLQRLAHHSHCFWQAIDFYLIMSLDAQEADKAKQPQVWI